MWHRALSAGGWVLLLIVCMTLEPTAQGFWHRRPAPAPQVCYVPVYINVPGPGGNGRDDEEPNATKVHFVVVCDTTDEEAGSEISVAFGRIRDLFDLIPQQNQGRLVKLVKGDEVTASSVRQAVASVPVTGGRDTLVVFCVLHGAVKEEEEVKGTDGSVTKPKSRSVEQNLLMNTAATKGQPAEQTLARDVLVSDIKARNPRLGILLTDSCFRSKKKKISGLWGPLGGGGTAPLAPVPAADKARQRFVAEDLFVNHEGVDSEVLNLNSASEDQLALAGVFPESLVEWVEGWDLPEDARWSVLIEGKKKVRDRVQERFDEVLKDPHPATLASLAGQTKQTVRNFNAGKPTAYPRFRRPQVAQGGTDTPPAAPAVAAAPVAPATPVGDGTALVSISAPSGAKVSAGGLDLGAVTNTVYFRATGLAPGQPRVYEFRSEVASPSGVAVETRKVPILAGKDVAVDLNPKAPTGTASR